MSGGILSPTFAAATEPLALVDGQAVASNAPGWQARLVTNGSASGPPTTITAQYLPRGQSLSSVLALANATWPGNVDCDVYLEQTTEIQSASEALAALGTDDHWLVAGVAVSRGPGDDPTHFATCTVALEIYDDATGLVTATSGPLDWTTMAPGSVPPLTAAEYQADPSQWAVLQRRWRVHWAFTITDSGAPNWLAYHGQPQFELSVDGTLPAYDPTFDDAATSVVVVQASLTTDQDNYNPAGLANAAVLVLSADVDGHTITGIAGGYDGRRLTVANGSTFTTGIAISPLSLSSAAGNRIGGDGIYLPGGSAVDLVYDGTNGLWYKLGQAEINRISGLGGSGTSSFPSYLEAATSDWAFRGIISPAQLVANTDDWTPTGIATATVIRVSTDVSRNLTGINNRGGAAGQVLKLLNIGTAPLVLKHDTTSGSASFYCPGSVDFTLNGNESTELIYDATSSRWRVEEQAPTGSNEQHFSVAGTWNKPATGTYYRMRGIAGGAGGGSGRKGAASTNRGGGGGGGGGGVSERYGLLSDLPASLTITIGAKGTGGASQTTATTDGLPGGAGGDTTIANGGSNYLVAKGGALGPGGTVAGGGPGLSGLGNIGSAGIGGTGGSTDGANNAHAGGAGATPLIVGSAVSMSPDPTLTTGGAAGAINGGAGGAGTALVGSTNSAEPGFGGGGGGSGASGAGNGGAGGNGGGWGSGGGGGGGAGATGNSGKGADGVGGFVSIVVW